MEQNNSDGNRRSYGNNRWIWSNIRRWLNSQAGAGAWYAAQHGQDAPPNNSNVWSNYNEYEAEAGFLAGFSANFIAALLTTNRTVGKAQVDGGGTETCTDKISLPRQRKLDCRATWWPGANLRYSRMTIPARRSQRRNAYQKRIPDKQF